jgi:hypothetical protein
MAIRVAIELFEDDRNYFLGTVLAPNHMDEEQVMERLIELQQEWLEVRDADTPQSDFAEFVKDNGFKPDSDELMFYTANVE